MFGSEWPTYKMYALNGEDGTDVAGWPISSSGVAPSPAIADIDREGELEIVVGATNCRVYAWNGDGSMYLAGQRPPEVGSALPLP